MTPEEIEAIIARLEREGSDAFHKHYSLGMWNLCAEAASALRFLLKEREQLREASQRVLDGLDARIDNAPGDAVPVFDGIAELHSALASPQRQGDRPETGDLL